MIEGNAVQIVKQGGGRLVKMASLDWLGRLL